MLRWVEQTDGTKFAIAKSACVAVYMQTEILVHRISSC